MNRVRMKAIGLLLFWCLALYSCKEVSFPQTQPAGLSALKEVPAELLGQYHTVDKATRERGDTLIIESWGYRFADKNHKDWLGRGVLSDSLVLKFYENIYFVNFKADQQWVLRLLRRSPSGDLEFMYIDIQSDEKRKQVLKRLGKHLTIKEIKRQDDTFYQINPTPQQLMTLINEGFFTTEVLEKEKSR